MDNAIKRIIEEYGDISFIKNMIISCGDKCYSCSFDKNLNPENLRSISKIVVALCFGVLISEKQIKYKNSPLDLNTKIWPFIKGKINLQNKGNLNYFEKITLKHLFTHTTGYDKRLLFSDSLIDIPEPSFLQYLYDEPLIYCPGDYFCYSNASAFLLSVVFQEFTRQNLSQFAYERIFVRMGILDYAWINYAEYCAGATGLSLYNNDLHKIGKLLIQNGKWNNEQIINKDWIDTMVTPYFFFSDTTYLNDPLERCSYGLFTWICKNGDYFVDGKGGQFLVVSRKKNIIITVFADTQESTLVANFLKTVLINLPNYLKF